MLKRILTISLALIISPFFILMILVFATLTVVLYKIPPFFLQPRIGKNKKPFICYKINSMFAPENIEDIDNKEKDNARTTKLGFFMRDHGIDELPQLLNILIGNMSFVGPRPLMGSNIQRIIDVNPDDLIFVERWLDERSKVAPGLSGWTQVHSLGKGTARLDLEYLAHPTPYKHFIVFIRSCIIFVIGKNRFFDFASTFN